MPRLTRLVPAVALLLGLSVAAQAAPEPPAKLYDRVTPSFVAVKYTWDFELRRQELTGPGIVISEDGLIMTPLGVFNMIIPDAQMKDFKIIIPSQEKDADEIEAVFVGRDERTNLAFLRPKKAGDPATAEVESDGEKKAAEKADEKAGNEQENGVQAEGDKPTAEKSADRKKPATSEEKSEQAAHKWTPIEFVEQPAKVGQRVWSVGVLPEAASYKTYLMEARVAVPLRGEIPQVLVGGGGLAGVGSVVFNTEGKAIGFVNVQSGQAVFLNDGPNALAAINNPPKFFTPASDLMLSLKDPPVAGKPMELPWVGIPQMAGLNKDVAEVYGLAGQPAVQVGDVIPDSPAAKAGLKAGDIITKVNGQPLERGDEADELPIILRRQLIRQKVGDDVTLSIIRKRGEPAQEIKIKSEAQPKPQNLAERFYAEDLGFGVREMVFTDTYARRLPADSAGVVVSLTKPQGNAQTAGLQGNGTVRSDVIISMNGQPVTDIQQFRKLYTENRKEKPNEPVVLVVRREGREETVRIEPPQ